MIRRAPETVAKESELSFLDGTCQRVHVGPSIDRVVGDTVFMGDVQYDAQTSSLKCVDGVTHLRTNHPCFRPRH